MKRVFLSLCAVVVFLGGCDTRKKDSNPKAESTVQKSPFSLSVVSERSQVEPSGSNIAMAHDKPGKFYVVFTNVSAEPQAVWEYWISWGYQTVTFELTSEDGRKFLVSKRPHGFTRNFPSTFLIEPGEHQVYAIRLDEWWEAHPALPKAAEFPITLKAIYEVLPTPEAVEYKVWTGRIESRTYKLKLRQW
jgi:hypothetical protein